MQIQIHVDTKTATVASIAAQILQRSRCRNQRTRSNSLYNTASPVPIKSRIYYTRTNFHSCEDTTARPVIYSRVVLLKKSVRKIGSDFYPAWKISAGISDSQANTLVILLMRSQNHRPRFTSSSLPTMSRSILVRADSTRLRFWSFEWPEFSILIVCASGYSRTIRKHKFWTFAKRIKNSDVLDDKNLRFLSFANHFLSKQ